MENDFFLTRDFAEFFFLYDNNRGWQFEVIVILNLRSLWDLFLSIKFTIRLILHIYIYMCQVYNNRKTLIEHLRIGEKYHRYHWLLKTGWYRLSNATDRTMLSREQDRGKWIESRRRRRDRYTATSQVHPVYTLIYHRVTVQPHKSNEKRAVGMDANLRRWRRLF